jgi:GntR family transcriptional regulator/MocR family aminotransferase
MVLPQDLLERFKGEISQYNQTSSKIEQIALSLFMKDGLLEKHIRKLRKIYAKKNQLLIDVINKIMGNRVNILGKETGLHILLAVKTHLSSEEIVGRAEQAGVKVIPISHYFMNSTDLHYPLILLSYGGISREHIEPAIKLLCKVWFGCDTTK